MALPHTPLRWFDGHLDLTYVHDHGRDLTATPLSPAPDPTPLLSFASLQSAHVTAICSTIFVRRRTATVEGPYCFDTPDQAFAAAQRQLAMHAAWSRDGHLPATRAILAIEGASCLRTVDDLDHFHAAGVRMLSLAWAEGNHWSGGDQSGGDVTAAGKQLISRLDALRIVHDVSHLSEQAFWTLLSAAQGPVVASHSNCRALLPNAASPQRHLSDEQIRALTARGGIIGLNLFARFLIPPDELKAGRRAFAADVARHAEHIAQLAGRRTCIALGSDMESGFGLDLMPADVRGPLELPRLADALSALGWSDVDIHNFAFGNWARRFPIA